MFSRFLACFLDRVAVPLSADRKWLKVQHPFVVSPRSDLDSGDPRVSAELVVAADGVDDRLDVGDGAVEVDDRLRVRIQIDDGKTGQKENKKTHQL